MDKKKWEESFKELREKKLPKEDRLRKIHLHKSVFKKGQAKKG